MRVCTLLLLIALLLAGCPPAGAPAAPTGAVSAGEPATLTLASHDSFSVSEELVAQFEQAHNVRLQFLSLGDAGEALNRLILSKDAPLADVFFGVDNTFLSRALSADIFSPYASPRLDAVPDELELDPEHRLLPVDVGYININADAAWFEQRDLPLPASLDDLTDPAYAGLLVMPNPATSSPGLAFLLATIAHYGEDGYLDFWRGLRANDVAITDGWSEAYYEQFTVGSAGAGARPLVVSYTSSPPADVLYATDGRAEPASANLNLPGAVYRQIEFAGILEGTQQRALAEALVDFMLDVPFQEDMPLQMFVYPVNEDAALPDLFTRFAERPADFAALAPADIDANREAWIQAWTDVMLR